VAACAPAAAEDAINLEGPWRFKGDWEETGQVEGWQRPDFDDSQWRALHVPGTWEEQGITTPNPRWPSTKSGDGYNGYAWYRRGFAVPLDWQDAKVTLRVGEINDYGWAYVNGRLVGSSTADKTPCQRREYLLAPDVLLPGEENVVAVRVCDVGGTGGIVRGPVELVRASPAAPVPEPEAEPAAEQYPETTSDIVNVGGPVEVPATMRVQGDVVAVGGSVDVKGWVGGDVVAVGGDVRARPGSHIRGSVAAMGGRVIRDQGAEILGTVSAAPVFRPDLITRIFRAAGLEPGRYRSWWWPAALGQLGRMGSFLSDLLVWALWALLAVLLFPRRIGVMARALPLYPGRAALYGLGGCVFTPAAVAMMVFVGIIVSVILAITVIGIVLIPAVGVAGVAALLGLGLLVALGTAGVWLSLGQAVAARLGRPQIHAVWAVLIGVLLMALAAAVRPVGPLVVLTVLIFGLGAAVMTGLGAHPEWAHRRFGLGPAQPAEQPATDALPGPPTEGDAPPPSPQ
jgi:hypothetical protein